MFKTKRIQNRNQPSNTDEEAKNYITTEPLKQAANVAIALDRPLLLGGDPGTGKTTFAKKIAFELAEATKNNANKFSKSVIRFNTKTSSKAKDLLYHYDAVSHYLNKDDQKPTAAFIELTGLGLAIANAHGQIGLENDLAAEEWRVFQKLGNFNSIKKEGCSSVLLIDEIDKAPKDFANDLLNEVENFSFKINELNIEIPSSATEKQVVVIMTSNFDKNLPAAFLRRCVYFNIEMPKLSGPFVINENGKEGKSILETIVNRRMTEFLKNDVDANCSDEDAKKHYDKIKANVLVAVAQFEKIKQQVRDNPPATAQLLDWLKILNSNKFFDKELDFENLSPDQKREFRNALPALLKSKVDLQLIQEAY